MVGVKPVPDALGRVNKLEVIPVAELGRPRIDVVVNCSGVFRDLFVNQMNLLDRAVKMVAELDESVEDNYVRKHALEQAEELGISARDAATRIFSNASGSYSSNVNLAVENSSWSDESQLQVCGCTFYMIFNPLGIEIFSYTAIDDSVGSRLCIFCCWLCTLISSMIF